MANRREIVLARSRADKLTPKLKEIKNKSNFNAE